MTWTFRGKRVDNGEWVKGLPTRYPADATKANAILLDDYYENDFGMVCGHVEKVDPSTVGIGIEIDEKWLFEGDFVEAKGYQTKTIHDMSDARKFVSSTISDITETKEGRFVFELIWERWCLGFAFEPLQKGVYIEPYVSDRDYQCVGNKWDNPELLGGQDEHD